LFKSAGEHVGDGYHGARYFLSFQAVRTMTMLPAGAVA
jgi:hypothetical protein